MAVPNASNKVQYTASGTATTFAFPYPFFAQTDLVVWLTDLSGVDDPQMLTTDYAVSAITGDFRDGANVVFLVAPTAGYKVTILRSVPLTQETDYENYTNFPADVFEDDLDKRTMAEQQLFGLITRQIQAPPTDPAGLDYSLPSDIVRASKFLFFNAIGEPGVATGMASVPATAWAATLLDDVDDEAARLTIKVGIESYDAAKSYNANWLVMYQGNIYKSLAGGNLGNTPSATSAYWRLLTRATVTLSSGSPYTLVAETFDTFIINATTNPYIVNLPQATTCVGYKIKIIDGSALVSGLVKIVPYTGDAIGQLAANTEVYLQNVDQSGAPFLFQSIELVATKSGYWDVAGGQFCPAQAVDTNGQQYHLGKLHHLPLGNATNRTLFNSAPPAGGAWGSAISAGGLVGIPAGAKAIKVRVQKVFTSVAAGLCTLHIGLSDNNSSTPSNITSHPQSLSLFTAAAAASRGDSSQEIDIPLNAAGQFYMYTLEATNTAVGSSTIYIIALGFYMGD